MWVTRLTGFEVSWVIEKVPFDCADDEGLTGLCVTLRKLHSGVGDEYASKAFLHILKIAACSKSAKARTKATSVCSGDVVG